MLISLVFLFVYKTKTSGETLCKPNMICISGIDRDCGGPGITERKRE